MKRYLNHMGFSLPEVLLAVGLVGGISLVTMKLMSDHSSNQAYLKGKAEIEKTANLVSGLLADRVSCNRFINYISGKYPSFSGTYSYKIDKVARVVPDRGENILIREGTVDQPIDYGDFYMGKDSIEINNTPNLNVIELKMTFILKNKSFLKVSDLADPRLKVVKVIPIRVARSPTDDTRVVACGNRIGDIEIKARKTLCDSLGELRSNGLGSPQKAFTWNPDTNQCDPTPRICPIGQVMSRVSSLGGYICKNANQAIDLDAVFDLNTEQVCLNGFSLTRLASGKIAIKCN